MPGPSASQPGRPEAHSPAHWDGEVEHAEHLTPLVGHEEVGDEGGCDGGVTGLPDPHQAPSQEEQPEPLGKETGVGRWHPTLQPASLSSSPASSGEVAGMAGEARVLESDRPELEFWLPYLLAVSLRKQLNLSEPQFPNLERETTTGSHNCCEDRTIKGLFITLCPVSAK